MSRYTTRVQVVFDSKMFKLFYIKKEIWIWKTNNDIEEFKFSIIDLHCRSCRGVASWTDPEKQDGDRCRRTVFMNTAMSLLAAIDAATGLPCPGFGNNVSRCLHEY